MSTLNSNQIAALTIGIGIAGITLLSGFFNSKSKEYFTNNSTFFIKKWIYITMILCVNVAGCVFVYYTQNLQIILFVILALKSKDILMSLMFVVNMIYKGIFNRNQSLLPRQESTENIDKILAFVPVHKESFEQLCKTVDSLIENKTGSHYVLTCIVSDGVNDYNTIFENVNDIQKRAYVSWDGSTVNTTVHYGVRNNKNLMLISKTQNKGKKDSIIMCNDIFNYSRENMHELTKIFRDVISSDIVNVFGVSDFDYIFTTDSDTTVSDNTFVCLIDAIETRNAVASCGVVNVDFSSNQNYLFDSLQNYQYLYGQFLRRTNEDVFGQVLCLPGCISMFKIQEKSSDALELYSTNPNNGHLVESSVQYIGTDRRYTSNLIYTNNEARIVLDTRCNAYTVPPSNFKSYVYQRKRWTQNTYFNTMINIIGPNVNIVSRLFNFIDYVRLSVIYFRLFNTIYFIYLLSSVQKTKELIQLTPYIVVLSWPIFCFLVYSLFNSHLRNQYFRLLVSLVINKVFILFSTIIIFSNMIFNLGKSSWSI